MALTYSYTDQFLRRLVTEEVEDVALEDVTATYASFSAAWLARLVPLRAYIIVCQRNTVERDDTFSVKLGVYQKEYDTVLAAAKKDTTDATTGQPLSGISFRIERG